MRNQNGGVSLCVLYDFKSLFINEKLNDYNNNFNTLSNWGYDNKENYDYIQTVGVVECSSSLRYRVDSYICNEIDNLTLNIPNDIDAD